MSRKSVLYLALVSFVVAVSPVVADGGQTFFGETTASSPTFLRTNESGTATGTSVHYQAQAFEIASTTTCYIYGQQDYDGYLFLYRNSFNPGSPTSNFVDADDDADLGVGTSQLENLSLTAGHYILVNGAFSSGVGTFSSTIHCGTDTPPLGVPCAGWVIGSGIPDTAGVCLNNRFLVWIDNVSSSPTGGIATPVRVGSNDTGIFWFYFPTNFEVMVKVLNGCGLNSRWWIFAAALTNQSYRIRVFDGLHPEAGIRNYSNFFPNSSPAITDTSAFATCP